MMRTLVVAGTYQQFRDWQRNYLRERADAVYVDHFTRLQGVDRLTPVALVGTYYLRSDWRKLAPLIDVLRGK